MRLHSRLVKPGFWTDTDLICEFTRDQRHFYLGLWQLADDSGCLDDNPRAFKLHLFPLDDDLTPDVLALWAEQFIAAGKAVRYQVGAKHCLWLTNFCKHQTIKNPTAPSLPLPEWITWNVYPSNSRKGKYVLDADKLPNDLRCPYSSLTDGYQIEEEHEEEDKHEEEHEPEEEIPQGKAAPGGAESPRKPAIVKQRFEDGSEEYTLASLLKALILGNDPHCRVARLKPEQFQEWCLEINRLTRIDGRDPPTIRAVINWCQTEKFWKCTVQSASGLRRNFDRMYAQMTEREKGGSKNATPGRTTGRVAPDQAAPGKYDHFG